MPAPKTALGRGLSVPSQAGPRRHSLSVHQERRQPQRGWYFRNPPCLVIKSKSRPVGFFKGKIFSGRSVRVRKSLSLVFFADLDHFFYEPEPDFFEVTTDPQVRWIFALGGLVIGKPLTGANDRRVGRILRRFEFVPALFSVLFPYPRTALPQWSSRKRRTDSKSL
jgi:hypothetical protein